MTTSPGDIITPPQGGGALQGIGEKFSPGLFTGSGNFTVPLAFPPGRNGFKPQLSLSYSTGNGNGPFGLGWALSVPGIARKTSKGIPQYDDTRDVLILSGAQPVKVRGVPFVYNLVQKEIVDMGQLVGRYFSLLPAKRARGRAIQPGSCQPGKHGIVSHGNREVSNART